jgi:hypothetical protein
MPDGLCIKAYSFNEVPGLSNDSGPADWCKYLHPLRKAAVPFGKRTGAPTQDSSVADDALGKAAPCRFRVAWEVAVFT